MRRVLILASLVAALELGETPFASEERAEVIRVVDGDTIVVRISGELMALCVSRATLGLSHLGVCSG